jgi:hypothetical protein
MKQLITSGSEWQCATTWSSLRHGDRMTRNLYEVYHLQWPQDTYAYSGNTWKSSWENQHRRQTPLGQIYRDDNGNYYGKEK